ncbi:MAG: hypothetical protein E7292_00195 [Lachnospiraceae bacterium]|nr:hypothetical protein [Lachnospiraceae bacterium]
MDSGFWGDLFDLDHDGELDPMERAMDFMAFEEMTKDEENDDEEDFDNLEEAGLDYEELLMMDAKERQEILEDAELDPDDYDF